MRKITLGNALPLFRETWNGALAWLMTARVMLSCARLTICLAPAFNPIQEIVFTLDAKVSPSSLPDKQITSYLTNFPAVMGLKVSIPNLIAFITIKSTFYIAEQEEILRLFMDQSRKY